MLFRFKQQIVLLFASYFYALLTCVFLGWLCSYALSEQVYAAEPETLIQQINGIRDLYYNDFLTTADNSPYEVLMAICSFGCDAQIIDSRRNRKVNAIGALCSAYSVGSIQPLNTRNASDKRETYIFYSIELIKRRIPLNPLEEVFTSIDYFTQTVSGEYLSVLAQSAAPIDYKFQIGEQMFCIADLVESEKRYCHGSDLSALLVGLSYYASWQKWVDVYGVKQSVVQIAEHELTRIVPENSSELTDRLFGLSFAYYRRYLYKVKPIEPVYLSINAHLAAYLGRFLKNQNPDGSWNESYLQRRGNSRNPQADFIASANIIRWILLTIDPKRLNNPQITTSVGYLIGYLRDNKARYNSGALSLEEIRAYAHALQALDFYKRKAVKP